MKDFFHTRFGTIIKDFFYIFFWTTVIVFIILLEIMGMIELVSFVVQGKVFLPGFFIACFLIAIGLYIWKAQTS